MKNWSNLYLFAFVLFGCMSEDTRYNYDLPEKGNDSINYKTPEKNLHYEGMSYKEMTYHANVDSNASLTNLLYEKTMTHYFSNNKSKDQFKVIIHGDHYYNSTINFTITTPNGKEIYHDSYPCLQILDEKFDGGGNYGTHLQIEEYVKKYVSDFFHVNNFSEPAIPDEKEFSEDFANKEDWDDIKSDSSAIGFTYISHAQSKTEIAFSKKKNMTVKYYQY